MATLNLKGFPEDLYQILGQLAKKDRRSLTAEAIYLLEWAIKSIPTEKSSILQLRGLGKESWNDRDVTKHITDERDSWQ